jgi:hypothetical protein
MRLKRIQFGEVERLDLHHKALLDFIKNNPRCTENQVVKAMEMKAHKVCSKMTTLRKIDELIEKQEIKDLLEKGKTGFHRFIINENNEFNKIYNDLSEIDKIIDNVDKSIESIYRTHPEWKKKQLNFRAPEEIRSDFENFFFIELSIGFSKILQRINAILSENDSRILYDKLINVITKMYERSSKTLSWDMLDEGMDSVRSILSIDNLEFELKPK